MSKGERGTMQRLPAILVIAALASICVGIMPASESVAGAAETTRPFIFGLNPGTSDAELRAAKAAGCTNIRIGGAASSRSRRMWPR